MRLVEDVTLRWRCERNDVSDTHEHIMPLGGGMSKCGVEVDVAVGSYIRMRKGGDVVLKSVDLDKRFLGRVPFVIVVLHFRENEGVNTR